MGGTDKVDKEVCESKDMMGAGRILTTKHSFPFSSVLDTLADCMMSLQNELSVIFCKRKWIHFLFFEKWNLCQIPSVCVTSSLLKINNIMSPEPLLDLFLEGDLWNNKASVYTLCFHRCVVSSFLATLKLVHDRGLMASHSFFFFLGRQNKLHLYHKSRKILLFFALCLIKCEVSVFWDDHKKDYGFKGEVYFFFTIKCQPKLEFSKHLTL